MPKLYRCQNPRFLAFAAMGYVMQDIQHGLGLRLAPGAPLGAGLGHFPPSYPARIAGLKRRHNRRCVLRSVHPRLSSASAASGALSRAAPAGAVAYAGGGCAVLGHGGDQQTQ